MCQEKLLCSGGGWVWQRAYRKFADFKFQPPALRFVLSLFVSRAPCTDRPLLKREATARGAAEPARLFLRDR